MTAPLLGGQRRDKCGNRKGGGEGGWGGVTSPAWEAAVVERIVESVQFVVRGVVCNSKKHDFAL